MEEIEKTYDEVNPYAVTGCVAQAVPLGSIWPLILQAVLLIFLVASGVLAFLDAGQEGLQNGSKFFCALLALVGHIPGLLVSRFDKGSGRFLVQLASLALAACGFSAYLAYFNGGPATRPDSVGQLHVYFFPIVYAVCSVFVLGIAYLISDVGLARLKHNTLEQE